MCAARILHSTTDLHVFVVMRKTRHGMISTSIFAKTTNYLQRQNRKKATNSSKTVASLALALRLAHSSALIK